LWQAKLTSIIKSLSPEDGWIFKCTSNLEWKT